MPAKTRDTGKDAMKKSFKVALKAGSLPTVEQLIKQGASVNQVFKVSSTDRPMGDYNALMISRILLRVHYIIFPVLYGSVGAWLFFFF